MVTNWLELIQPGLVYLHLFAPLHLSKGKRSINTVEYCTSTVLAEVVLTFVHQEKDWLYLRAFGGTQFSLRSKSTKIC